MKTTIEASNILENIANKKGFKVYGTPYGGDYTNQSKKTITMNALIDDVRNIKLSHEIGHIYIFKVWKWFILLNELVAWTIGYFICVIHKINTKNFWGIAIKCLKTYVKN